MAASKNFSIYEGEDYEVRLEYNRELLVVHLPVVYKFNRSVYISMKAKLEEIHDFSVGLGYPELHCAVPLDNTKTMRLAVKLGFEYITDHSGLSIYRYIGV